MESNIQVITLENNPNEIIVPIQDSTTPDDGSFEIPEGLIPKIDKENTNIPELLTSYHIETQNKLDQILKYFQDELEQEKTKRLVLEKKIESINSLIEIYSKEN
jgi:hypothetical protein